jgi:hypothetical protein
MPIPMQDALKEAFFCGALHLFSSIMVALEPGEMETENDMRRMDDIRAELDRFGRQVELKYGPARGSA